MSQLLIANIEKYLKLTQEETDLILSVMQKCEVKKKQFFAQQGQINNASAFVLSGCMRSYIIDANGFEHVLHFAIEDWWIADMPSHITQKPGTMNIDALEDSTLLTITREDQLWLFEQCPRFEKYFRIITEKGMVSFQNRVLENMSLTAMERYQNFVQRYPAFQQRLPQTQIAAYLGITPEFLSKIRGQLVAKS